MMFLEEVKKKRRMILEQKVSMIVKLFILVFTFPLANLFGVLYSVLKHLQNL
jgi:hypothetical protein